MNIEPNGAVRKPAPHTKNTDDDAMIAELYSLDEAGLLIGAAPTTAPAKSAIRTSRQTYLGQSAEEIGKWRARWHRENPNASDLESAVAYFQNISRSRPDQIADPEGYERWYDALSDAQRDTFEQAHWFKLDRDKEDYKARKLAEGHVVISRQRNPTRERELEQGRDRQAEFMSKKTVEERQEIGRKARANQPPGSAAARQRAWREKNRQEALAAAVAAVQPAPAPAPIAPAPAVAPKPIALVGQEAMRKKALESFKVLEKGRATTPAPAPAPVATLARVTPVTLTVIDDKIAELEKKTQAAAAILSKINPAKVVPATLARLDQMAAEIARAQAAKAAAVTSADPGRAVVAWLVAEADLSEDADDQPDLTDELAELDEALAAAAT